MKIKTKLRLGFSLLFIIILILGALSAYYLNKLSAEAKLVLKDNYETLEYTRLMLYELDKSDFGSSLNNFERQLIKQESNLTEPGEQVLTAKVRHHLEQLKATKDTLNIAKHQQQIRASLNKIMDLNLKAIIFKNELANKTAHSANLFLIFWGGICLLITFSFIVNFPGYIANPIKLLTEGIKEIEAKNYNKRLSFTSKDEFGELAQAFNSMAQKLHDFENSNLAKILFEKKRIEAIINSMNDGVIGLDEHQHILFVNPVALKLFGLNENDLVGKFAPDVALKNDLLKNLLNNHVNHELKIYADAKESYFKKEALNILVPQSNLYPEKNINYAFTNIGSVYILKNITAFHELDEAKTNFIATISHELKTPISSIKMSTQLLKNKQMGDLNPEQNDLIESIQDDTHRLLKITSELLNMAQLESGHIQLNILPASPIEILDYAIQATKTQAEQKQIKFEINYSDTVSKVLADKEKTAWVITNLIANAIRYSHEQSVINVKMLETTKEVKIIIKDQGQGIAPQYLDKIFERYFRVPGTQKEGTGLGLAISKDFIEAQGGNISVDSEFGVGSVFTLTLIKSFS
ncbi:sensor histidine kinase [Pedobacter glucosidilyticus]|uniref:sensor histidine kinase n=1 Tax=Pedobacter glucosidilyticus TaxID=1122941 RepID=UPI0004234421|nr:ATP-binding protein [Pedobacter glucosidilyticus]